MERAFITSSALLMDFTSRRDRDAEEGSFSSSVLFFFYVVWKETGINDRKILLGIYHSA